MCVRTMLKDGKGEGGGRMEVEREKWPVEVEAWREGTRLSLDDHSLDHSSATTSPLFHR